MGVPPPSGKGAPPLGGKGKGYQLTYKEKKERERKDLEAALSAEANFSGQELTSEEKYIIEENGTEYANSGEYNHFQPQKGYFACRKCGNPIYSFQAKFVSGCGWPAFDKCYQNSIIHKPEDDGTQRTSISCSKCNGHLGHVFVEAGAHAGARSDQRHCANSLSLRYVMHDPPVGTVAEEETLRIDSIISESWSPPADPESENLGVSDSPRFDVGDPALLEHLDEHGYVVIRDVAKPDQIRQAEDHLWEFLSDNAGWSRNDPSSWTDTGLAKVSSNGIANGIVNKCGAGQSELNWFVRTLPQVRALFQQVWSTSDLVTSYDTFGIFRPWHHGFSKTLGGWLHVDQGRTKLERQCVQGFLSLYDQDATTGGLVVIPGSHTRHDELLAEATTDEDYIEVPEIHPFRQLPRRIVRCAAGDFVLWDSRCVHCNTPAVQPPLSPGDQLLRAVVYVCMTPKAWASQEVLEKRQKGYEIRITTTHWPHVNVMGFGWARAPPLDFASAPIERRELIC